MSREGVDAVTRLEIPHLEGVVIRARKQEVVVVADCAGSYPIRMSRKSVDAVARLEIPHLEGVVRRAGKDEVVVVADCAGQDNS